MKNGFCLSCALSALLFVSTAITHAQVTIDVAKITRQQFLVGRMLPTKSMALWFGGYFNGKRGVSVIEASAVKANGKKLEEYCGMHQDETVMKAAETLFGIK